MYNRWMELKKGSKDDDDDDEVDVEHIVCSVCSQPDGDGNDILFCDRKGCYRAYHQNCLDPPYNNNNGDKEIDLDEDWFCWHCQCIDDCLDVIGEILDDDHDDWQELFPEVKYMISYDEEENSSSVVIDSSSHNNDGLLILRYDSKEEEEDEDYVPSIEEEDEESLLKSERIDGGDNTSSIIDNNDDDVEKTGDKKLTNDEEKDDGDNNDCGEEDDDEDEDDDDDDGSDDDDVSELEIDEDEVKGLIKDAEEIDPDIMRVINDDGDDDSDGQALSKELNTYNKKRLRPRRNNNNSIAIGDKRFMIEGEADKGKIIARVVRGVIQTGSIERVRISGDDDDCLRNSAWIVRFDGDHQSFEVDYQQIMNYFDVYMDYTRLNNDDDNVNDDGDGKDSKKRLVDMEGNHR